MIFIHKIFVVDSGNRFLFFSFGAKREWSFEMVNFNLILILNVYCFFSFYNSMTPCQKEYHATLLLRWSKFLIYPKIMRMKYIRTYAHTHTCSHARKLARRNYKSQPILMNQLYIVSLGSSQFDHFDCVFFLIANFNATKISNSIMYFKSLWWMIGFSFRYLFCVCECVYVQCNFIWISDHNLICFFFCAFAHRICILYCAHESFVMFLLCDIVHIIGRNLYE